MAYAYHNSVNLNQANAGSISAPSITPNSAGDQLIVVVPTASGQTLTPTDNLGTPNVYTTVGVVNLTGISLYIWIVTSCEAGATVVTVNQAVGTNLANILVADYSGLNGAFSTPVGAYQSGPGIGVNILSSGNATAGALPAMVFGICFDSSVAAAAVTAGTSPLAFNNRGPIWSGPYNGFEDARITSGSAYAATFGTVSGNQFDNFNTIAIIFPETGSSGGATVAWLT